MEKLRREVCHIQGKDTNAVQQFLTIPMPPDQPDVYTLVGELYAAIDPAFSVTIKRYYNEPPTYSFSWRGESPLASTFVDIAVDTANYYEDLLREEEAKGNTPEKDVLLQRVRDTLQPSIDEALAHPENGGTTLKNALDAARATSYANARRAMKPITSDGSF